MRRACGSCHECCVFVEVKELNKPADMACPHLDCKSPWGHCGIHATRPNGCKLYTCGWLAGLVDKALKPDACGILFEIATIYYPRKLVILIGWELKPGAVSRNINRLKWSAKKGQVLDITLHDKNQKLRLGSKADLAALDQFFDEATKRGVVENRFADGVIRTELPLI